MNITIVIPVSDDLRIKNCIKSIDEDVNVLLSLNNPSKKIEKFAKKSAVDYIKIDERGIGKALERGIRSSKNEKILIMDSDCIFEGGTIYKLYKGLETKKLSKGRVIFTYKGKISQIIARAREFHTSDEINAYSPPLALRKNIIKDMEGYYFDEDLKWVEDEDFDKRVKKSNIEMNYDETAIIYHPSLTPFSDLKSSFCYGNGRRIGYEKGILDELYLYQMIKDNFLKSKRSKGLLVALYMLLWSFTFYLGYQLKRK